MIVLKIEIEDITAYEYMLAAGRLSTRFRAAWSWGDTIDTVWWKVQQHIWHDAITGRLTGRELQQQMSDVLNIQNKLRSGKVYKEARGLLHRPVRLN